MPSASSSLSNWHRQQHKKQQQKNKTARIAARDAAVVETKTAGAIQKEIRELLKHNQRGKDKDESLLPHGVKSKLDRLRKELRLVEEKEKKLPRPPPTTTPTNDKAAGESAFQKLEHPQVSVYYDAVLNPFGAAPPGQPMLYHRRGGVTRNLVEAWVPGQPEIQLTVPQAHSSSNTMIYHREGPVAQQGGPQAVPLPPLPPGPPPPPPLPPLPPAPKARPVQTEQLKREKATTKAPTALAEPEIPQHRPRRKILDVWAQGKEEEELAEQLEEEVALTSSIEVAASSEAVSSSSPSSWYYRDTSNRVQGPFETAHMLQWIQAGFFLASTPAKRASSDNWSTLGQLPPFRSSFLNGQQPAAVATAERKEEGNPDLSVQDRIQALRSQVLAEKNQQEEPEAPSDSVLGRIQALRAERTQDQDYVNEASVQEHIEAQRAQGMKDQGFFVDEADSVPEASGVEARIAALKAERQTGTDQWDHQDQDHDNEQDAGIQERIDAMRAKRLPLDRTQEEPARASLPPPPPPPPPLPPPPRRPGIAVDDLPTYPVFEDDIDESNHAEGPTAYPIDFDSDVVAPYLVDDDSAAGYPTDEAYPTNDDGDGDDANQLILGGDDVGVSPVTGSYPVTDAYPAFGETVIQQASKRRLDKVDKEVVSLLPSHLQKRRRAQNTSDASAKSSASTRAEFVVSSSSANEKDDLEQLFNEVDGH